MIAGVLCLGWKDIKAAKITDAYSIHRLVYDLFEDVRTEKDKKSHIPSGILYVDKGGDIVSRKILFLSDRMPRKVNFGYIETKIIPPDFLNYDVYRFEVVINPTKRDRQTKKLIPIKTREEIASWFSQKSETSWGFVTDTKGLDVRFIRVLNFCKKEEHVTLGQACITGFLHVKNREQFIKSFNQGIGRGRSFGCGLLQIVPAQI